MATKKKKSEYKLTSNLAREKDGTVQITFTVPQKDVDKAKKEAAQEIAKDATVPGFRKGKAPIDKVIENTDQAKLTEQIVWQIIPAMMEEILETHKIKPAIYPKLQLVKTPDDGDWQIRAVTAELPEIKLGDYKKAIQGEARSSKIWTPEKGKKEEKKKEPSREEKENLILKVLLNTVEVEVPHILVEDEVNARLSQLLDRVEKLGLNLDSYLASVGKDPQKLREEYEQQAKDAIKMQLILNKIAEQEKLEVSDKEVEETVKATDNPDFNNPDQRSMIKGVLLRRKAIEQLLSYVE